MSLGKPQHAAMKRRACFDDLSEVAEGTDVEGEGAPLPWTGGPSWDEQPFEWWEFCRGRRWMQPSSASSTEAVWVWRPPLTTARTTSRPQLSRVDVPPGIFANYRQLNRSRPLPGPQKERYKVRSGYSPGAHRKSTPYNEHVKRAA